jgi:DNA-binding CsgD family transcriptional regulator
VGRDDELSLLHGELAAGARSVVIAGAVGVGKSRLWSTWLSGLEARGLHTVVVRATESTSTIQFGAFARWVPGWAGGAGDPLAVLQASAARLAGGVEAPIVAVDDAHHLDHGSAALLLHLAEHTRADVVVTVRSGEPCPDAVTALWKEGLVRRLDLEPLSEAQTAELLEGALGQDDGDVVAPATRQRLWHLTQGNPLYLGEVVESARSQGVLVRSAGVWQWQGRLTGSSRLVELVGDRLGETEPDERRVLELVALGDPLPIQVLSRLAPRPLLAELERRGLLVADDRSPDDGGHAMRLAHPLYSEVLRAGLPLLAGQAHRLALAQASIAAGAHEQDLLRVASWLLDSGGRPTELAELDLLLRASFVAQLVNDYELSARLARVAEEAGGGWRATLRRAEALGPLQRWDQVDALLSRLSSPEVEPEVRAAAARLRAEQSFWHRGEELAVAQAIVADAAEELPPPARSALLTHGARLAFVGLDLERSLALATGAVAAADSMTDRLHGLTTAGLAAAFLGRTRAAVAIAELVVPYAAQVVESDPAPAAYAASAYAFAMVLDGRIDDAAVVFEMLLDQDFVLVGGAVRALAAFWLARAVLAQGRVELAARLSQEALGLLGDENHFGVGSWVAATVGYAAAQAGDARGAAAAIAWADARSRRGTTANALFMDLARVWLRVAHGELPVARDVALGAARQAGRAGAWTIELTALLDATRLGAARQAAPRLDELTRTVEGPYAPTAAHFARAAAAQDGRDLDAAADRFEAMGARLLAAEASAAAAAAHQAEGDRRSQAASQARAQRLSAWCGASATPLLARLGQSPAVAHLTDRQREVAELAARGRASREIAEMLTVSVRTVDSHLHHTYVKLGVRDRAGLAAALAPHPQP